MVETGLVNAVVTGIVTGSVVALGAIGLALVYSIAEVPNFAHGELLTIGAYMALLVNVPGTLPGYRELTTGTQALTVAGSVVLFVLAVAAVLGLVYFLGGRDALAGSWAGVDVSPSVAAAVALVVAAVVGVLVVVTAPSVWTGMLLAGLLLAAFGPVQERIVFRKFREKGVDLATMLIVALGVSFVLRFTTQAVFGGQARGYEAPNFVSAGGFEFPLSAAQFFDFYLTSSGLVVEVINTKAVSGQRFVRVLVAGYSWPAVALVVLAAVAAAYGAYRWRLGGPEGFTGGQTVGPRLAALLAGVATFAVAVIVLAGAGAVPESFAYATRVRLSVIRIGTVTIAVAMMAFLHVLLKETKLGVAMRAASDNLDLAKVTGINTDRVMMATWVIAGAYAAVGGVMVGLLFAQITPNMGFFLLLPMFAAVILGGVGSVYGAILGSFVVGLSMDVGIFLFDISGVHRVSMAFVVLLVVLLVKPEGIVGES